MSSPAPWNDARSRLEAANLGILLAWPNEAVTLPDASAAVSPVTNPLPYMWAAVQMTGYTLAPMEVGDGGAWLETGTLFVHIMTPAGWGTDDARTLGKTVANTFRGLPAAPVVYMRASIGDSAAEDEDGAWWRLTVMIDWRYQDIDV